MTVYSYGQRPAAKRRRWSATDRRYQTYRWRIKTRLPVLKRDRYRCWVMGCERPGDVADHIDPVGPHTTDAEFFDQSRIRASCRGHNLVRGMAGPEHEAQFGMVERQPAMRSKVVKSAVTVPDRVIRRDYTRRPK